MYRRTGLAAWPSDCFYDPGRPTWLPYWIDTTTESQNKLACALSTGAVGPLGVLGSKYIVAPVGDSGYSLPPSPITIIPPDMSLDPTGSDVNVDSQISRQAAANQAALQAWAAEQASATPVDNASVGGILNNLAAGGLPITPSFKIPSWVIYAGLGVGALFVLNAVKGLR